MLRFEELKAPAQADLGLNKPQGAGGTAKLDCFGTEKSPRDLLARILKSTGCREVLVGTGSVIRRQAFYNPTYGDNRKTAGTMTETGDFYQVQRPLTVQCLFHYAAPYTRGEDVILPDGLVFELERPLREAAGTLYAHPVERAAWEPFFVPREERSDSGYSGYSLVVERKTLEDDCRRVPAEAARSPADLTRLQALQGCMIGVAVGDAIGLPFEGLSARRIAKLRALPLRHRFIFGRGMLSDDTEHSCFVAQALIESGGDPAAFGRGFTRRLRWWLLGLPAGVGSATLRAGIKSWLGFGPRTSGVWSAGNGPAMRSGLIGVYAGDEQSVLRRLVEVSTLATHRDPKALRGALIVAKAAALNRIGNAVPRASEISGQLAECISGDEELLGLVRQAAASAAAGETARQFCDRLGWGGRVSGYIYRTVPVVLQIWLRHPRDYRKALSEAVECGGDTDTVGAILGGIVGAGTGLAGIPADWRDGLVDWPRSPAWMLKLADELAAAQFQVRPRRAPRVSIVGVLLRNLLFLVWVLGHGFRRLLPPY